MRYVCNGVMIQKLAAFNKGTSFLLFPLKVNGAGGVSKSFTLQGGGAQKFAIENRGGGTKKF